MALETFLSGSTGIFGALRQMLDTVLGTVQQRVELVSVELREEKTRVVSLWLWSTLLVFLGFMAMATVTLLVVLAFWEQKVWVLGGFSVFYLLAAIAAWLALRREARKPIFPETINQLKKDREWILPKG